MYFCSGCYYHQDC